jgi:hypothetical protein
LISAQEASVRGRLYELPSGFPALVVPETDVQATGTTDYLADAEAPNRVRAGSQESYLDWDMVHGELLSFEDPEARLPALDGLEGFRPGEQSLYKRVLIPVTLLATGTPVLAWTYVGEAARGVYLPGGRWPAI